jgi:hypothetical protein
MERLRNFLLSDRLLSVRTFYFSPCSRLICSSVQFGGLGMGVAFQDGLLFHAGQTPGWINSTTVVFSRRLFAESVYFVFGSIMAAVTFNRAFGGPIPQECSSIADSVSRIANFGSLSNWAKVPGLMGSVGYANASNIEALECQTGSCTVIFRHNGSFAFSSQRTAVGKPVADHVSEESWQRSFVLPIA